MCKVGRTLQAKFDLRRLPQVKMLQPVCVHYGTFFLCHDKITPSPTRTGFCYDLLHSTKCFQEVHMSVLQEDNIV